MNIVKNDKVILINEFGKLKTVGQTYEVANFTDTAVVMRDATTKIAMCAIDIDMVDDYFMKAEEVNSWTPWHRLVNPSGDVVGFYRTNLKKVQVKMLDGCEAEATCNKCDSFNLVFGINLAFKRAENKSFERLIVRHERYVTALKSRLLDNSHSIEHMVNSLEK